MLLNYCGDNLINWLYIHLGLIKPHLQPSCQLFQLKVTANGHQPLPRKAILGKKAPQLGGLVYLPERTSPGSVQIFDRTTLYSSEIENRLQSLAFQRLDTATVC